MKVLDAKTAAEEIHAAVENRLHPTAEDRHIVSFVTDVCGELGLEPTAVNVAVVADALHEAGIQPHLIQHYPKMAVDENGKAILLDPAGKRLPVDARGLSTVDGVVGSHVIFESEDEEKAFGSPKEGDVVKPWTVEGHDVAVADHIGLDEQGMPHYDSDAAAVHDAQPRAFTSSEPKVPA